MYEISVDVGGTFTDFVFRDSAGSIQTLKVPSNPQYPLQPIQQGLIEFAEEQQLSLRELLRQTGKFLHGTTLGINALLQGHGAKTALLTTAGFRDALEIRRSRLKNQWDFTAALPPVLVPRYLRLGVTERMDYLGVALTPVDEAQIQEIARFLVKEEIEAVAICFLFSCQNPDHERQVKALLQNVLPELFITLSSELSPQLGEYERTVTTVLNARISPLVNAYLDSLQDLLQKQGLTVPILVAQNKGGLTDRVRAGREAVLTLFSGPAGGAKGGWALAQNTGLGNLVIADMGGTSLDISLVREGRLEMTQNAEIAGYPVQIQMLDIHTVGAGGGSIAWLDNAGMLCVGPQSAGANPGPACYGLGGKDPTITDATLILGLLDKNDFLGGRMELDREQAYRAIQQKIAEPLKMTVEEAAYAICQIALSRMVDALYLMTIKKGYDPRTFTLVSVGGALSLFATALARGTGIRQVIVPDSAPVFCADGLHYARLQVEGVRSALQPLNKKTPELIVSFMQSLREQADDELDRLGVESNERQYFVSADLKYTDQHHTLNVSFTDFDVLELSERLDRLTQDFHAKHHQLYGYSQPEHEVQLVNLRIFAEEAELEKGPNGYEQKEGSIEVSLPQPVGYRSVFLEGHSPQELPVYDWDQMQRGQIIQGPAIIRKPLTTLFIDPLSWGEFDAMGNFRITIERKVSKDDIADNRSSN